MSSDGCGMISYTCGMISMIAGRVYAYFLGNVDFVWGGFKKTSKSGDFGVWGLLW